MKRLAYVLGVLVLCLIPAMPVYAGEISGVESALITIGNGRYEYDGSYYEFVSEYKTKLANYLSRDDIDLTQAEVNDYIATFYGSLGDLVNSQYMCKVGDVKQPTTPTVGEVTQETVSETPSSEEISEIIFEEVEEEISQETSQGVILVIEDTEEPQKEAVSESETIENTQSESESEKDYSDAPPVEKQLKLETILIITIGVVVVAMIPIVYIYRKKRK